MRVFVCLRPPSSLPGRRSRSKARQLLCSAMSGTLGVTDAFVVTSGRNSRQVRTIVDEVERQVKIDCGYSPLRVEGRDDFGWVLMDYGDFVVHVFLDERRSYYDLERLWGDAPRVDWESGHSAAVPAQKSEE